MLDLRRIAVTGRIGSGKSSVLEEFQNHGAFTLSADQLVHEMLSSNSLLIDAVVKKLGPSVLENGVLNRKKIAEIVFSDDNKLKVLEDIIHPIVKQAILSLYKQHSSPSVPFFVAEIPLLSRVGLDDWFDVILLVESGDHQREERWCKQGKDRHQFFVRDQKQKTSPSIKPHFVIQNNGSKQELQKQVTQIINKITKEPSRND